MGGREVGTGRDERDSGEDGRGERGREKEEIP